jgi:hypothetical protein
MKWLFLSLLIGLSGCVVQRSVVRQPDLLLQVLDSTNQPIADAQLYLYWWSNPYSSLQESQVLVTDAGGVIQTEEVLQTDTAYPLMLHGVQEFRHTLCIEVSDYRTVVMTLNVSPGEKVELSVQLTLGESLAVCSDFEKVFSHPGTPRPDIANQHPSVQSAYEITGQ